MKSADGTHFSDAGFMQETFATGANKELYYNDLLPFSNITFYRARIYSGGDIQFSSIVKVQQVADRSITVIPNPAHEMVQINFNNREREKATIRIIDTRGKVLIESSTNNAFIHYDISHLAPGMYLVQVVLQGQVTEANKLVVQ
ncbi:MAG: T9SS type A sorting domain-containing protein [Chitinophagaceae bacterium]|nr:T9SS type A sorting domain-containing protein [Chitinophagaceae bacterium]